MSKDFSEEELKRLRKVLRAIDCLNGLELPKKILKKIHPFHDWLLEIDSNNEQKRSITDLFLGWIQKRKRKKLWESFMEEKFTEITILQLETTLKDSQLCLEKSKLELEFLKRERKRGKQKPSYVH